MTVTGMQLAGLFYLLFLFQIKHFLADYPLQFPYMLKKFGTGYTWVMPLSAHCLMHAVFTFTFATMWTGDFWFSFKMAAFDFSVHFVMDRLKADPRLLGRYDALSKKEFQAGPTAEQKESNTFFWWVLGFDQMVHHLTDLVVAALIFMKAVS